MKNIYLLFCTLSLLFICNTSANAQWVQTNGPLGGNVSCLEISGSNIFTATNGLHDQILGAGGISLSSDKGASWKLMCNGLTHTNISSIVQYGTYLFAASLSGDIYRSSDNGNQWTAVINGLPKYTYPNTLTVSGTTVFTGTTNGIFLSTDSGANWNAADSGLSSLDIIYMKTKGSTVFAVTLDKGIFKSTDDGTTWTSSNNGITDSTRILTMSVSDSAIYVGTISNVYISTDNGSTWIAFGASLPYKYVTAIIALGNTILLGVIDEYGSPNTGIFLTADGGANWANVYSGEITTFGIMGQTIYAGTAYNGMLFSADTGKTWMPINNGVSHMLVNSVALAGTNMLVSTTGSGVFSSPDTGKSWTMINGFSSFNYDFTSIVGKDTNIYMLVDEDDVMKSSDYGASWKYLFSESPSAALFINKDYIYLGSCTSIYVAPIATASYLQNWSSVDLLYEYPLCFTSNGTDVYAGVNHNSYVYKSSDNGITWTGAGNGMTGFGVETLTATNNIIFAGSDSKGVYKSTDTANSWSQLNNGISTNSYPISSTAVGTNIFIGTAEGLVYWSDDGGSTWTDISEGLISSPVSSLCVIGENIYAGTRGAGIWKLPLNNLNILSISNSLSYNNDLTLFPNPSTNQLTIHTSSFHNEMVTVSVMNVLGQEALSSCLSFGEGRGETLDISKLPAGMYFLQLKSESGSVVKKFVKE